MLEGQQLTFFNLTKSLNYYWMIMYVQDRDKAVRAETIPLQAAAAASSCC